jgi:hypothetical protein
VSGVLVSGVAALLAPEGTSWTGGIMHLPDNVISEYLAQNICVGGQMSWAKGTSTGSPAAATLETLKKQQACSCTREAGALAATAMARPELGQLALNLIL